MKEWQGGFIRNQNISDMEKIVKNLKGEGGGTLKIRGQAKRLVREKIG